MERENSEEGWGFYYVVVQAVRAAVLGFAEGKVNFGEVDAKTSHNQVRYAPLFSLTGEVDARSTLNAHPKAYTAQTVSDFLGWSGVDAQANKAKLALSILAAVERNDLPLKDLADTRVLRAAADLSVRAAELRDQGRLRKTK